MSRDSLAVKKIFVAFKTSTIVFNIINKMSVNCRLFIYQLTTNFLAKYQLTTFFLGNCQLTTNPISTLLLNTLWFNNTIHFGLRGCKEHREMCWGDVKLCQTSTGQEYLEFNERETKTRSGNDPRNVRAIAPKMFAVPNNEKCPVKEK